MRNSRMNISVAASLFSYKRSKANICSRALPSSSAVRVNILLQALSARAPLFHSRFLENVFPVYKTEDVKVCSYTMNCLREQVLTWVYIGARLIVFSLKIKARFEIAGAPAVLRQFNADSSS